MSAGELDDGFLAVPGSTASWRSHSRRAKSYTAISLSRPKTPPRPPQAYLLHCRIQILRVEATSNGAYGLACRIEEYSVSRWKPRSVSTPAVVKTC